MGHSMFQKYVDALTLMDQVIEVGQTEDAATPVWDKLYTFVHANFPAPKSAYNADWDSVETAEFEADVEEMVVMFAKDRDTLETELRKIPPVIAEVAFPVYIARHLLRDQRVAINPSKLETFTEFHNRYGYMIINGADQHRK